MFALKEKLRIHLIDWTGQGFSGGQRFIRTIGDNHTDFGYLLKKMNPDLPLFIYGHSMGATIVLSYLMLNPSVKVAGLIVSAPPTGMNHNLNPVMKFLVKHVVSDM